MKCILILHRGFDIGAPEGHQAHAFVGGREEALKVGIRLEFVRALSSSAKLKAVEDRMPEVIVDFRHWSEPVSAVRESFQAMREMSPNTKIVLMDYYAQTSSPHFELIEDVDTYAKRQVLVNVADYDRPFEGGYIFTDFLVKDLGFDLKGWHFGVRVPVAHAGKIRRVWNLGAVDRYWRIARSPFSRLPWGLRPISLNSRITALGSTRKVEWYQEYRSWCAARVEGYGGSALKLTHGRVSRLQYYGELASSRIAFSPFGWGEVCFRDYESVACGCLLLKPDMAHLKTEPDIFRPMETYVPVRWDLADLYEKLDWIKNHPSSAAEIAHEGRRTLIQYFQSGGATSTMIGMLSDTLGAVKEE